MAEQSPAPIESLNIKLDDLVIDPRVQARVRMDGEVVDEYAEAMKAGASIPSVDGVRVAEGEFAGKVVIWDGFHRIEAARKCGVTEMPVGVRNGSFADAIDLCTSANAAHGLRRTNEDKRHAVLMALALDKQLKRKRSDRQIAIHVGVHNSTVSEIQAELSGKKKTKKDAPAPSTTEQAETASGPETTNAGVMVDELGRPVNDPKLRAVLALCPEFDDIIRQIGDTIRRVMGLTETVAGDELKGKVQNIKFDLGGARSTVEFARPYTACPYGPGCAPECLACRGRGWVSKETWGRTPENIRNQAISHVAEVSESDTTSQVAVDPEMPEVVAQ